MNEQDAKKRSSNQLGTFAGVFTPSILTILGLIMFMRANFVLGEAGIIYSISNGSFLIGGPVSF